MTEPAQPPHERPSGATSTPAPRDEMAELEHSYKMEDHRYARKAQVKDWLWLGLIIFGYAGLLLLVFAFEPGMR